MLAIAAQIPSCEIGSGYFQETHPEQLFKDCSHYCELVSQPEQMPRVLGIAMRTAIARRGVAVVVIPGDIALRACSAPALSLGIQDCAPIFRPSDNELGKAAQILNKARKVAILGGAGCAGAHAQLVALAEQLKAPIVHALRGKEFIEYDNPYDVGMTGLLGFSSGYHAMMNCDVLLMLGTDFPYQQFYPKDAKIIQVDRLGEQIGRRTPVDLGLIGNVKDTLEALTPLIENKTDRSFLDTCLDHYKDARKGLDDLAVGELGQSPVHPQYVAKILDELAAEDAVFTCDVGTPTVWAARYLKMNGKRGLLGSFIHGSMANALPQAIGVQASHRNRQVISLSGDGGLAMLLGDLLTLRQLKLPVKLVVFNNSALGFVEMEMKAAGLVDYGTELTNPNFAKLAESAGVFGSRVKKPEELRPALAAALAHDGTRASAGTGYAANNQRRPGLGLQPLHDSSCAEWTRRRSNRSCEGQPSALRLFEHTEPQPDRHALAGRHISLKTQFPPSPTFAILVWSTPMRRWRNWQTHQLEVLAPKGIGVQVPSSAPNFSRPGQPD